MQYKVVTDYPHDFFKENGDLCISIYLPTHRDTSKNSENTLRLRNLIKDLDKKLSQLVHKDTHQTIIKGLKTMNDDRELWNKRIGGMGIFANEKEAIITVMQNPPREISVVGSTYYTKPLLRDYQGLDEYQVLTLDLHRFDLYEGNRTGFRTIEPKEDEPRTIQEFLGEEYDETYLAQGSYGGASGNAMFHGHKSRKDEIDKDIERYLNLVDKHVLKHYSSQSKKPLILYALPEYHQTFIKHSKNPYLLKQGIEKSPRYLNERTVKDDVWQIMEPRYNETIKVYQDSYEKAIQNNLATDKIAEIAKAAVNGRVETLLIEAFRQMPGSVDKESGTLISLNKDQVKYEDIFDDLLDIVISNSGKVIVIPSDKMPTDKGAAAIFRY